MKRMLAGLSAIAAATGLLAVPASAAPDVGDELPNPDRVKIVDVTLKGTGCN